MFLFRSVCVVLCKTADLRRADPPSKESTHCLRLRNLSEKSVSRMPYAPSGSNRNTDRETPQREYVTERNHIFHTLRYTSFWLTETADVRPQNRKAPDSNLRRATGYYGLLSSLRYFHSFSQYLYVNAGVVYRSASFFYLFTICDYFQLIRHHITFALLTSLVIE
jgi:hypothetical protein